VPVRVCENESPFANAAFGGGVYGASIADEFLADPAVVAITDNTVELLPSPRPLSLISSPASLAGRGVARSAPKLISHGSPNVFLHAIHVVPLT
jgi:hypothetical protein